MYCGNLVLAAREEAFNELAAVNPELHALEIGPPLEWVIPQPSTEGQTSRTQPFRKCEYIIPEEYKSLLARVEAKNEDKKDLLEFNVHGDQLARVQRTR